MINWNDIDVKNKVSGTMKTICPNCSHTRKKKTDPCLSVNIDKGAAHCWNCNEVSWRDPIEQPKKEYALPPQEWQNYTNLSDGLVKWFASRGIRQETLIKCRITEETHFIPRDGKEMNCVVFNYFYDGKLVNKKYRSGKKGFSQIKDARKVFYGIDDIVSESECFIVEGEMDRLTLVEKGITNCVSVPNGANDLNDVFENCEREMKAIDVFIIAVDMDEPGLKLEQELVKRLGKNKCKRIKWKGKDANEDLISDCFDESVSVLHDYPIEGTFTAKDLASEILDYYQNGLPNPIKPKGEDFKLLNESWSILLGQLTVITGIPSHGKSNWLEWYLLNIINDYQKKMSLYSPEHLPMSLHHSYLAEKVIGKPFQGHYTHVRRMSADELDQYIRWSSERIYLTSPEDGKTPYWGWLLDKFKEQIFRYGVDIFVIDAFNKVKRKGDSLSELNEVLADLALFCQYHNVAVFLVAHPTKMRKKENGLEYEMPNLYDIKGSGDFADQSHNGATIYRKFGDDGYTDFIPLKLKFRHQGTVNGDSIRFKYNKVNGRYHSFGQPENNTSLLDKPNENDDDDIFRPRNSQDEAPF